MANDETFRYDPTPMNHAFPGQPDDCFDMVNQYGTYNIQKTADTDNAYPAIAQGMPKVGHFARRSKAMFDLAGGEKKKCFDTKKAERWFKERRIKFQQIDLVRFGMSGGEFDSVLRAVGGVDALIDWSVKSPEIDLMRYTDDKRAKEDKLFDHPELMKTPIVRNGRQATAGYCPEVWQTWE